jgi:hypothetical protein
MAMRSTAIWSRCSLPALLALMLTCLGPLVPAEAQMGYGVRVGEAPATGPEVAPNSVGFFTSYTLRGGHVAKGVAWRNKGKGSIKISAIPAGATVEQAFLYWAVLNPTETAAMPKGKINGNAIQGTRVSSCAEPCWSAGATFVYRADVTEFVTGNATYQLAGFASGLKTGESPWSGNWVLPLAEGATLVVVYRNPAAPIRTIVLTEGCVLFYSYSSVQWPIAGFVADPVNSARVTVFGADGQDTANAEQEILAFNGSTIAGPSPSPWNGGDGAQKLWDTHTYSVRNLVTKNSKKATLASTPTSSYDCMVLVGMVFEVTAKDTDGDGLVDAWERDGYDHDGDGTVDVDLPAMGAKVRKKDIFLEIDYMETAGHTHKPKNSAIPLVVNAFKNAPVSNPDGSTGIRLHVDTGNLGGGNAIAHDDELGMWSEFDAIKDANFAPARHPIFHYVIFAHNMDGYGSISGLSRGIPGRDLVVSLGGWTNQTGTVQEQAGTLLHELGHNIGLRHGGIDHSNHKPNYLSVMNYAFQTRGLIMDGAEGNFDYSRFVNRTLNEASLSENAGIRATGNPTNYGTRYRDAACTPRATTVIRPIDWNGNGSINVNPVAVNVNNCAAGTTHVGFNDWENLILDGRALGMSSANAFIGAEPDAETAHGAHPLAELDRHADSQLPPAAPARLSIAANALGAGIDDVTWRPVGLEIITHYNVYVEAKGALHLVDTVPADGGKELQLSGEYRWAGVLGRAYAVTAVDHYGNESELAVGLTGR